jgi:hypothetical protein
MRRKKIEARIQAVEMVKAFNEAMSEDEKPKSASKLMAIMGARIE